MERSVIVCLLVLVSKSLFGTNFDPANTNEFFLPQNGTDQIVPNPYKNSDEISWVRTTTCVAKRRDTARFDYTVHDTVEVAPILAMLKCVKANTGRNACKCRLVACTPITVPSFNSKKLYSWLVKKKKESSVRKKLQNACGY